MKVVDLDNDGTADDEYFIVRKYRDHFIPSITLALALQFFNKGLQDIEGFSRGKPLILSQFSYLYVKEDPVLRL